VKCVYLYHFAEQVIGQQRHYVGYTTNLPRRHAEHTNGQGAQIFKTAFNRKIGVSLVRVFPNGNKSLELFIKRGVEAHCPMCVMFAAAEFQLAEAESELADEEI